MRLVTGTLLIILMLALLANAGAAPLFDDDSLLEVGLTGPLGTLLEKKDDSLEMLFVLRANGIDHAIKVRVRGKSRRQVCELPPLRFNFQKKRVANSVFAGVNKLKFVTHCNDKAASRSDIVEEYAAYRIFNLLSEASYRVRLLHVAYEDTGDALDETAFSGHGFLIESASSLAARIGGQQAETYGVVLSSMQARQTAIVYIFQYMIGNTDWSMVIADDDDTCCHNGDLFDVHEERYYVPYDFDLAGLVNARYAKPDPSLRISRVTQRRYRGYCIDAAELKKALVEITGRKEDILQVVRNLPVLTKKEIRAKLKYLERFFALAENEDKMVASFDRRCL